jgi:hypothetical protein
MMTVAEAAQRWGVNRRTILKWISGKDSSGRGKRMVEGADYTKNENGGEVFYTILVEAPPPPSFAPIPYIARPEAKKPFLAREEPEEEPVEAEPEPVEEPPPPPAETQVEKRSRRKKATPAPEEPAPEATEVEKRAAPKKSAAPKRKKAMEEDEERTPPPVDPQTEVFSWLLAVSGEEKRVGNQIRIVSQYEGAAGLFKFLAKRLSDYYGQSLDTIVVQAPLPAIEDALENIMAGEDLSPDARYFAIRVVIAGLKKFKGLDVSGSRYLSPVRSVSGLGFFDFDNLFDPEPLTYWETR